MAIPTGIFTECDEIFPVEFKFRKEMERLYVVDTQFAFPITNGTSWVFFQKRVPGARPFSRAARPDRNLARSLVSYVVENVFYSIL